MAGFDFGARRRLRPGGPRRGPAHLARFPHLPGAPRRGAARMRAYIVTWGARQFRERGRRDRRAGCSDGCGGVWGPVGERRARTGLDLGPRAGRRGVSLCGGLGRPRASRTRPARQPRNSRPAPAARSYRTDSPDPQSGTPLAGRAPFLPVPMRQAGRVSRRTLSMETRSVLFLLTLRLSSVPKCTLKSVPKEGAEMVTPFSIMKGKN